jgi:hypothetical protein
VLAATGTPSGSDGSSDDGAVGSGGADADSTAEALVEVGGQPHVPVKKKGSRKR